MPTTTLRDPMSTPSSCAIAWAVEPCKQWHKENPGKPQYIIWTSERFARESADDTGGRIIVLKADDDEGPLDCPGVKGMTLFPHLFISRNNEPVYCARCGVLQADYLKGELK